MQINAAMAEDSTLSITASVIGILTFAVAVILGGYARAIALGQDLERGWLLKIEMLEAIGSLIQNHENLNMIAKAANQSHADTDTLTLRRLLEDGYTGVFKTMFALTDLLQRSTIQQMVEGNDRISNFREWLKEVESSKSRHLNRQSVMWQSGISRALQDLANLQGRNNKNVERLLKVHQQQMDNLDDIRHIQLTLARSLDQLEASSAQRSMPREFADISGIGTAMAKPASPPTHGQDLEEEAGPADSNTANPDQLPTNNPAEGRSAKSASTEPQTPTSHVSQRKTAESHISRKQAPAPSDRSDSSSSDSDSSDATGPQPQPQPQAPQPEVQRQFPTEPFATEPQVPLHISIDVGKCTEDGFSAYLETLPEHERLQVNFNAAGGIKGPQKFMASIDRAVHVGFGQRRYRFVERLIRFFLPSFTRKGRLIEEPGWAAVDAALKKAKQRFAL
ncbi:hypothetical protein B0T24DRAFT_617954 [Lasiosphaeria ovina]|uniref:Uncharacterized protein n=1 Tax=Lasiosphaeria ovina TaxID=92902 RepID=A0AAE0NAG8_9PEZI|nr:hypothetical protein B0T24DRAFT_617954 [Lasiosphaeria ovina]